uniref:Uncharacterized protein n=1 Tax=Gopherus agassizii TaxID=38772 RepID=A0A452J027_9SAUR
MRRRRTQRGRAGGGAARTQAMAGVFDIDLDQPEDAGSDEELEALSSQKHTAFQTNHPGSFGNPAFCSRSPILM